jgi:beta-galactosidase
LCAGLLLSPVVSAQSVAKPAPQSLVIDATAPVAPPSQSSYLEGSSVSPQGKSITLNSRYLVRNAEPWLPVMGEFHYTRVPEDRWEQEILKMKSGGVQIVSTYVVWIHHEEIEGQFDWSGRRDLRHFIELCAKHGMLVELRIGPWAHGEVRNGGFPDWLLAKVKASELRKNTPDYMSYVQRYYGQIGQQAKGLLWKDGGPIVGIQLENEYAGRGSHGGDEYILALKRLAIGSDLDVPLYTVTGWDNAVVPQGAVLPVYGGYPDAPWAGSLEQLPPSEVYEFRFASRVTGDMGMMGAKSEITDSKTATGGGDTPFMTAEMGGGMQVTYHRRPVIRSDDVAAMCPVMLGSGVNLYGTYMFQGGQNPEGKRTTLQESQSTGYPNDLEVKSYDFGAPLGEFGQERESFRALKLFNYFMNDFGDRLAPLLVHAPQVVPKAPSDLSVPRLAVRTNGTEGFVFWNNYVRYYPMPSWTGAQVTIKLPHEELRIPREPITVPSGAYFVWPFNLDLNGVRLKYSTAQLFTKLTSGPNTTYFFFAIAGISPQFAFEAATATRIQAMSGYDREENGIHYVEGLATGLSPAILLEAADGKEVRVVLLSKNEAESAWKAKIDGAEHLVFTPQQFYADESHFYLESIADPTFTFRLVPGVSHALQGSHATHQGASTAEVSAFAAAVPPQKLPLRFEQVKHAAIVPPVKLGPQVSWRKSAVALAPDDGAFSNAAKWQISFPQKDWAGLSEVFLETQYVGDVARLYANGRLLEDNFYTGLPWSVGLDRFRNELKAGPLELDILPLRKDAPVFLERRDRPTLLRSNQRDDLQSLRLIPEYQLSIDTEGH